MMATPKYRQEVLGLGHLLFMVTNKAVLANAIFALWLPKNQPLIYSRENMKKPLIFCGKGFFSEGPLDNQPP